MSTWLYGSYYTKIENQMFKLSNRHADALGSDCIVCKGFDDCLYIYSEKEFFNFTSKLSALPSTHDVRALKRYIGSNSVSVRLDGNEFMLPDMYKDYFDSEIYVIGVGDKLELWRQEPDINFDASSFDL